MTGAAGFGRFFVGLVQAALRSFHCGLEVFDQRQLLGSKPAFDLLLTGDGGEHVAERFEIDERVGVVAAPKSRARRFALCCATRRSDALFVIPT